MPDAVTKKRPQSVTVIGWILIVMDAIGLLSIILGLTHMNGPAPGTVKLSLLSLKSQIGIALVGQVVYLAAAILILRGQNMGRWLYVGSGVIGFAINLWTSRIWTMLILASIPFLVVTFFLFRPRANHFFDGKRV